jgi:L-lactate dehydrogenase (cytochrome)
LRAAAAEGITQAISNNASCTIEEIMTARSTNQPLFFQFYMNRNREASEAMLHKVEESGFDVVLLTVDAAVPGKRERDQRVKGEFVVSGLPRLRWNKADGFVGSRAEWDR